MKFSFAHWMIVTHVLLVLIAGWFYFRRYTLTRPPIGVLTLGDVLFMLVSIVLVPYLYLVVPNWLLVGLLLIVGTGILYITLEPVVQRSAVIWLITLLLVAVELALVWRYTTQHRNFLLLHNLLMVTVVVGITNLWAQSGMKARDAALLGVLLAVYDFVFTVQLPVMGNLIERMASFPFAPLVAWPVGGDGQWLGIGLGDLLLATVFPLVMRKAFNRQAGWLALILGFAAIVAILVVQSLQFKLVYFPVMVILGPLMGLQYLVWRYQFGSERTTQLYRAAEPL
jgi:hypothetical protein